MKEIAKIGLASIAIFAASAQQAAAATCELNGEIIPCDQMPQWFWGAMIGLVVVGLLAFVFWLWMLIDAIKNQKENKAMWVLLLLFLNTLGAIIYFFAEKRTRKSSAM